MPFDTQTAARRALAETGNVVEYKQTSGQLPRSVQMRWDLSQSTRLVNNLKHLLRELPGIITRIEREEQEHRRLFVAASELRDIASRVAKGKMR